MSVEKSFLLSRVRTVYVCIAAIFAALVSLVLRTRDLIAGKERFDFVLEGTVFTTVESVAICRVPLRTLSRNPVFRPIEFLACVALVNASFAVS